jgi:Ran GTPase-activating protein (RanGAP) involved in mRNA processing and transport
MQRPDVSAVLDEVNVSHNPIGVDGSQALANAIPESSLQWIVIGKKSTRIPLHNSEITSLDVSDQELGPGEVTVVAAAILTYAILASVNLSGNRAIDQESRSALQESVSSRQPTIELIWDK